MTHKYIVSVPGRRQPLCIEADSWKGIGDSGALFFQGENQVASLGSTDLIAKAEALPDFPELSQFSVPLPEPACLTSFAEPLPAQTSTGFNSWGVPAFWPFLSGAALGFIGGFGIALSHAGVW